MYNNRLQKIEKEINRREWKKKEILEEMKKANSTKEKIEAELQNLHEARKIASTVARQMQNEIQININNAVNAAFQIFSNNLDRFEINFVEEREKTIPKLYFRIGDKRLIPLASSGFGLVNIAAFILRVSLWSILEGKIASFIFSDEPFRDVNDLSRRLHKNAARLVESVSKKKDVQLIIISLHEELREVADNVIDV